MNDPTSRVLGLSALPSTASLASFGGFPLNNSARLSWGIGRFVPLSRQSLGRFLCKQQVRDPLDEVLKELAYVAVLFICPAFSFHAIDRIAQHLIDPVVGPLDACQQIVRHEQKRQRACGQSDRRLFGLAGHCEGATDHGSHEYGQPLNKILCILGLR